MNGLILALLFLPVVVSTGAGCSLRPTAVADPATFAVAPEWTPAPGKTRLEWMLEAGLLDHDSGPMKEHDREILKIKRGEERRPGCTIPPLTRATVVRILLSKAGCCVKQGRYRQAERAAREVLRRDPENVEAAIIRDQARMWCMQEESRRLRLKRDREIAGWVMERYVTRIPYSDVVLADFDDWVPPADPPDTRPAKVRVAETLAKPVTIEFPGTSFEDVIDFLWDVTGINFRLGRKAMDWGKRARVEIKLKLTNVRLSSLLDLVLDHEGYTYVIDPRGSPPGITVTNDERAKLLITEGCIPAPPPPRDSPAMKALREQLSKRVTVEFPGTDFRNVLDFLRHELGLMNIVLDPQAPAAPGPGQDSPSIRYKATNTPLRVVLDRIVAQVHSAWIIRDEAVFITSPKRARALLKQRAAITPADLLKPPTSRPTSRPAASAVIRSQMAKRVTVRVAPGTVEKVVALLEKQSGTHISLDAAAREAFAVETERPFRMELANVRLASALNHLAREAELHWYVTPKTGRVVFTDEPGLAKARKGGAVLASGLRLPATGAAVDSLMSELQTPVSLEFPCVALHYAVDFLQDLTKGNLVLDPHLMREVSRVPLDVSINAKDTKFDDALGALLGQVGMTYVIRDEAVFITSHEKARSLVKQGKAFTFAQLLKRTTTHPASRSASRPRADLRGDPEAPSP